MLSSSLFCLTLLVLVTALPQRTNPNSFDTSAPQYTKQANNNSPNKGFSPTVQSFRPTTPQYEPANDDDVEDNVAASSQAVQSRTPSYDDNYPIRNALQSGQRAQPRPQAQPYTRKNQSYKPVLAGPGGEEKKGEKEEELEEEPDRLTLLLPQSSFDCAGKSGYYADESLDCEVFHYCHDNAKHSWVCPDGFTFHQVHLICMPPGVDNICEKSTQFHFVNEYLYKPINLEEHQRKPNVTLRYSDRYYPENFYEHVVDEVEQQATQQRQPIRVALQQAPAPRVVRKPASAPAILPTKSDNSQGQGQVFRSPEEVNISLQHRKPAYVTQRYLSLND